MSNRYLLIKSVVLLVAVWVGMAVLHAPPAYAKIYKWKDENGKVHFTDNLSKIPPQYREGKGLEILKEAPRDSDNAAKLDLSPRSTKEYVIALKPLGNNFVAEVLLNGKVRANLLVDTGASSITLSKKIAKELGIRNQNRLPKITFSTAGGEQEAPLIVLKKVQVGGAVARNVEASINPHAGGIGYGGLLGMTFLGDFKVEIRLDSNEMVLRPLHDRGDLTWGGHSGSWWKKKFSLYTKRILYYEHQVGSLKSDPVKAPNNTKLLKYYKGLHKSLDKQANQASLPDKFRSYP